MKRTFGFGLGVLVTLAVALPTAEAHGGVQISIFKLRDKSLNAAFETADSCVIATTFIRFAESVEQTGGPPIVSPPLTQLEVDYSNGCTGEFFSLTGGTTNQVVHIAGDLSSASLSAIVPVTDGLVNANVTLNVTWKANAPVQVAKDSSTTFDPVAHTITFEAFDFKVRTADVAGHIDAMLPLAAGPTQFNLAQFGQGGQLGKDVFGTRTVTFLPHSH
jgi:hypothetical protein